MQTAILRKSVHVFLGKCSFSDRSGAAALQDLRILTPKALRVWLTNCSSRTRGELTPFHLLTALPCSVGRAVADKIVPHGVTHSTIETRIDLL